MLKTHFRMLVAMRRTVGWHLQRKRECYSKETDRSVDIRYAGFLSTVHNTLTNCNWLDNCA